MKFKGKIEKYKERNSSGKMKKKLTVGELRKVVSCFFYRS